MFPDFVGAQAPAIAVDFGQIGFAIHRVIDFCCQYHCITSSATLRKPSPYNFFRITMFHRPAIDIGRIEKINTQF